MGWMAFIGSLVRSLAGPVTAIALVCVIWFSLPEGTRERLITRLREVGPGGAKFDQAKLDEASGEVS